MAYTPTPVSKLDAPHAVYWMYNKNMELLYVGCSMNIGSRLASTRPWIMEVAAIKVKWYPNEITGRRAEAQEILAKRPKYNLLIADPDGVGMEKMRRDAPDKRLRGDGLHCPKCGNEKKRRTDAYCRNCYLVYQRRKRLERKAAGNQT